MNDSLLLLSNFMKNPKEVGAVAPSSKFLTREIVKNINFSKSKNIIELGPGLGTFTKAILKKARPDAKLFCFEVNKKFCDYIRKNISDERLVLINAGAEKVSSIKKFNVKRADCIISGLPFRNFSYAIRRMIFQAVKDSLTDEGKFILFQYTNGLGKTLSYHFSNIKRKFVALNVPPSFVYVCQK